MKKTIRARKETPSSNYVVNNVMYETLMYADGSTSCNCPGWTRHVGEGGVRSCRHTREMEAEFGTADASIRNFAESVCIADEILRRYEHKPLQPVEDELLRRLKVLPSERMTIERIDQFRDSARRSEVFQAVGRIEPKAIVQTDTCAACTEKVPDKPIEKGWLIFSGTGYVCPRHLTKDGNAPKTGFTNIQRGSRLDVGNIADRLRGAPAKPGVVVKARIASGAPNVNVIPQGSQPVRRRFNWDAD